MPKRFAVWFADDALVATLKATAVERQVSIVQFVSAAVQQAIAQPGGVAACTVCEERRRKWLERYRLKHPKKHPTKEDASAPKEKVMRGVRPPRICPLCDTAFVPPIRASHQKYCCPQHTKYAFDYKGDMTRARPAWAAFQLRRQQGSKR
jgi:hypothetical protein